MCDIAIYLCCEGNGHIISVIFMACASRMLYRAIVMKCLLHVGTPLCVLHIFLKFYSMMQLTICYVMDMLHKIIKLFCKNTWLWSAGKKTVGL